jgi:hypothetical protein
MRPDSTSVAGALIATTVDVEGGLVDFTAALTSGDGNGALDVYAGGILERGGVVDASHTVTFKSGSLAVLELGAAASFAGTIAGFTGDDIIDLQGAVVTGLSYSGSATSGVLTVSGASGALATLSFTVDFRTGDFAWVSDSNGGTDIIDSPPSKPQAFVGAVSAFAPRPADLGAAAITQREAVHPLLALSHPLA